MADSMTVHDFNSNVLCSIRICFQLDLNMCCYCLQVQKLWCFFLLHLLNDACLKERVRQIKKRSKSENKTGNGKMHQREWSLSANYPREQKYGNFK